MSYGRYAGEVQAAQARYDNRLASLQSSIRENDSRAANIHSQCSEQRERIQRARQSEVSKRDKYWNEQLALKEKQWAEKEAAVEKEMDAKIEQERQEKMKTEQRLKQEEQCVMMKQPREREQVELAERERYEEAVRAARRAERHQYKPSLSTGIYGSYMLQKFPENSVARKILHKFPEYSVSVQSGKFCSLESRAHHQHDDDEKMEQEEETDVLYQQMYAEHKKVDEEYKLEFKPECNVIGCCNQPEVDPKLLKGDMYICKAHRAEMVDQFKQSGLKGEVVDDVLGKYGSMSDAELLQQGEQMEADDYFLKSYTTAQHRRVQIAKKLSALKRNSSEYWRLKLEHKRLQKCCDFLVMIRKISNPISTILAVLGVFAVRKAIQSQLKTRIVEAARERERRKKVEKEIAEAMELVDKFQDRVSDLKKMKNDCVMKRKVAEKKYQDIEKELNEKLKNADSAITAEETKRNNKIMDKNKKKKNAVEAEEKSQEQYIEKQKKEENKKIEDAEKHENQKIKEQKDQWQQQKTSLNTALKQMRKDFEAAKKEAPALDAEAAELEDALAEEDMDEAVWEKKMARLEALEEKRSQRAKLEKDIKDKDSELKQQQKDHDDNMKKMEDMKKERLNILRDLKKENMDRLKEQKKDASNSIKAKFDGEIHELEKDKDRKIDRLKSEKEKIQRQLRDHQTTGKQELEQVKRECERKQRQYEREMDEANFQSAKARAKALCRETSSTQVAVYFVYDKREYFWSLTAGWGNITSCETYERFGNFCIAKFAGPWVKKPRASDWTKFQIWTKGRWSYSYRYYEDNHRVDTFDTEKGKYIVFQI